jgi:hypothetical protein
MKYVIGTLYTRIDMMEIICAMFMWEKYVFEQVRQEVTLYLRRVWMDLANGRGRAPKLHRRRITDI